MVTHDGYTDFLFFSGFGFSIPSNETIAGMVAVYSIGANGSFTDGAAGSDSQVYAGFSTGVYQSQNMAQTLDDYAQAPSVHTRGASDDDWNWLPSPLTYSQANDSTFGFGVSSAMHGIFSNSVFTVVDASVTLTLYTVPSVSSTVDSDMQVANVTPVGGVRIF